MGEGESRWGSRLLSVLWLLLTLLGIALALVGDVGADRLGLSPVDLPAGLPTLDPAAGWVPQLGAVVVGTAYVWALAARTGGRPVVFGALAAAVGAAVLWTDHDVLRNGAAAMLCVVSAVLAVVATVPAAKLWQAAREAVVAALVAAGGALATLGLAPTGDPARFEYVTLGLSLAAAFGVVYRLGAGLHGLGRRGIVVVVLGGVMLGLTLVYAELLRRYGTPLVVGRVLDGLAWLREHAGASPRPIVALLGVPALVWGTHMRAWRRQGWWVCAFGVGATAPIAQVLLDPSVGRRESLLALGYGLVVGLVGGLVLIALDRTLTGGRGRRGRRARRVEDAAGIRPEPARTRALL